MVKYTIPLRNIQNVASSRTALIDLPIGKRYHRIILEAGYAAGTNTLVGMAAHIAEIRLKINGRVQRVYSGTQLRDLTLLQGVAYDWQGLPNTAPGVAIPIYLAEPWRTSPQQRDAMAWETSGWQSFQLEVELGAVGSQTALSQTLVAHAVVDNFVSGKPPEQRAILKQLRQSSPAGGVAFDIATLERRDFLTQISIYPDSGASRVITKVTLRLNGESVHEVTGTANFAYNSGAGMFPTASGRTASMYDLVLDNDDDLGSAVGLAGLRDATLSIESGALAMSGTTTYIVERFGPPE